MSLTSVIITTTLKKLLDKDLQDAIFNEMPLLDILRKKGQVRLVDGGEEISIPLMYGKNSNAAAYSDGDTLTINTQTGITRAMSDWAQYFCDVSINGGEASQNRGESQVVDLLEAKKNQAVSSIADILNTDVFSTNDDDSTGVRGLQTIINISTSGIVEEVDGDDYSWWRNQGRDSFATDGTNATSANLLNGMEYVYNSCKRGMDRPDIVVTSADGLAKYASHATTLNRLSAVKDNNLANLGFEHYKYKNALMFDDPAFPSDLGGTGSDEGYYFINSKYLKLVAMDDHYFKVTEFVRPYNVDKEVALILFYGNLITNNRRMNGVLYGCNTA